MDHETLEKIRKEEYHKGYRLGVQIGAMMMALAACIIFIILTRSPVALFQQIPHPELYQK